MTIYRLAPEIAFPDPEEAELGGLLAVGGDLCPERLLAAYAEGIFPWYEELPILWFSPEMRMAFRPAEFHVARRLRRTLRQGGFEVRLDTCFEDVIRSCATSPRPGPVGTWITPEMIAAYCRLHELGFSHSAEVFVAGELVGGVYGVSLGGGFFAESMFHRRSDASKLALVALVWQLRVWGFDLFDCQLHSDHLEQFGAREWPRSLFRERLAASVCRPTRRGPWQLEARVREALGAGSSEACR